MDTHIIHIQGAHSPPLRLDLTTPAKQQTQQQHTVDKKRANSCVLKNLFLERVEHPKISAEKSGNTLSDALLLSCFQNFVAGAAKKRTALRAVLINSFINSLIRIHSGPNILRSCFLHCPEPLPEIQQVLNPSSRNKRKWKKDH